MRSLSNVCRVMKWYPPREMTSPKMIKTNEREFNKSLPFDGTEREANETLTLSDGVSVLIAPAEHHYAAVLGVNLYKVRLICCDISAISAGF